MRTVAGPVDSALNPVYMAVSLPPDFKYPADDTGAVAARSGLADGQRARPCFDYDGWRPARVNPNLREAGDASGPCADVTAIERLCAQYPEVRFLVTFLSRENQHELCVAARKFSNLMPFGCWWFLNNPSIVSEITREAFRVVGPELHSTTL